jgi:hypothetical protein
MKLKKESFFAGMAANGWCDFKNASAEVPESSCAGRRIPRTSIHPIVLPNVNAYLKLLILWAARLSGRRHKYGDVRGKAFLAQARRERRTYPLWV